MSDYHESIEQLPPEARDVHRALSSLKEEVEAIDWYHQRVVLCQDPALRAILAHNRDEEMEHACMAIEWLRRSMPGWDARLRTYLFKDGPIKDPGDAEGAEPESAPSADLGIRSLRRTGPTDRKE